jgi:hypothetical protein
MQRPLDWKVLLSIDQRVSMKKGGQDGMVLASGETYSLASWPCSWRSSR